MQPAPALTVEWRTGNAWWVAGILVALLALATSVTWAISVGGLAWVLPLAGAMLAGTGLWPLRPQPSQRLRWDGHQWWLAPPGSADEVSGALVPRLDFGAHLLLQFDGHAAAGSPRRRISHRRWLALSRASVGGDWHALRCALYWSGAVGAVPAAADPPS
jgi:hypothetical protein